MIHSSFASCVSDEYLQRIVANISMQKRLVLSWSDLRRKLVRMSRRSKHAFRPALTRPPCSRRRHSHRRPEGCRARLHPRFDMSLSTPARRSTYGHAQGAWCATTSRLSSWSWKKQPAQAAREGCNLGVCAPHGSRRCCSRFQRSPRWRRF